MIGRPACTTPLRQEPGLELGQLGLRGLDLGEGGGGLGGVQGPDRDAGHGVELIAGTGQRPGDRVRPVRDRCHGPIPALSTDPDVGPESLCGQGFPVPSLWTESGPAWGCGVSRRSLSDLLNHRGGAAAPNDTRNSGE